MNQEVEEAIWAGRQAQRSLQEAKSCLDHARGWGIVDLIGGNEISGLMKHMNVRQANRALKRAQDDLQTFSREAADVQELVGLQVNIGGFLTFADFFLDGLVTDIWVQSKIKDARRQVDQAIVQVDQIMDRLQAIQ
ncbi:hypothetical protein [Catenisphaera adipataccumulans]|jgi:hypothetical protein|uniref:Uncharacterized protein n=1 Tax=Catenisphaera adipataccumulans TaxID=700500 RepID=A0A7W8CVW6_9FIRM|nr:hypothetical protein [Catenisphaera adipataccumulans]MBB5182548.1 hypothetical protein [Catenisphaera adipataccumulans]